MIPILDERTAKRAKFLIDVLYIAVIAALVYLAYKYVAGWILPFLLAFCIVSIIHPLAAKAVKIMGVKQEVVSIIIMLLIYVILGTLLFLLILQITFIIRDGLQLLPRYYRESIAPAILTANEYIITFTRGLPQGAREQAEIFQAGLVDAAQNFLLGLSQRGLGGISALTGRIPAFMIGFAFTIMLSFFISAQYDKVTGFLKTQLPPRVQKIVSDAKTILADTIFKYLRAALTLMAITFIELSTGLMLLGKQNAIAIAAGIAVFDALPFFGTGAIVIPWAVIEFLGGNYAFAAGLLILYAVVYIIRQFIEPKIVGDKLGLNPIVTLVAIYLGYKVFGVLGMIAMPIITQIMLQLHKKGSVKLFREKTKRQK
jgi:sporulation integral membrane protein YtvI